MKKLIIILCIMVLALGMAACEKEVPITNVTFSGEIIEIQESSAIIEVFEGEAIRSSGDKVSIDISQNDDTFAVGDIVKVTYDGSVMESYPLQVNVIKLEKVEK